MSLNISDALNATSQQGLSRTPVNSSMQVKRTTGELPEGSDQVPKPKGLPDEPVNPVMRAPPTVSTEEALRRLPETAESSKARNRVRKGSAHSPETEDMQAAGPAPGRRSPYETVPVRRRNLDIMV
jgi:hypothetical protein